MSAVIRKHRALSGNQRGFGLIELMVALILGLLVSGAAIAIFSTNRQTYAAAESLGRIQENTRIAYELMARDLRDAGGIPCSDKIPIANVVTQGLAAGAWWSTWGGGIVGYGTGATTGEPAKMTAGTDAIQVIEADDNPVSVVTHDPSGLTIATNTKTPGMAANDIALMCDYRQASMFQIAGVDGNGVVSYAKSGLNCGTNLSFNGPTAPCTSTGGIQYANGAMLARVRAAQWYVGANNQGGTSLFQAQLRNNGTVATQEIVEGVSNMSVAYLLPTNTTYVAASAVGGNWSAVTAVQITLTMQGGEGQSRVSTTNSALTRTVTHVITLRNHTT